MDSALILIQGMKELCDKWFLHPIIQPYSGATSECMFCGRQERRGVIKGKITFSIDHSEDCPYTIYTKLKDGRE